MSVAFQKPKMVVKSVKPSAHLVSPGAIASDQVAKKASQQPSKSSNSAVGEDAGASRTTHSKQSTS